MLTLKAKTRTVFGKKNSLLRERSLIPAVVYGHKVKNQNLEIAYSLFSKVFAEAGESSLINLCIDDAPGIKVLIQDVQIDPLTQKIIHIDFHQVREDEKITAEVELNFIGRSRAEKEMGGVLVKNLDAIEIQCLPKDLVHEIDVDLSSLNKIGDVIYVKDLKTHSGVKVLENENEPVVSVIEPRSQKELEELEEKPKEEALPEGVEEKAIEEGEAEPESKEEEEGVTDRQEKS